MAVISKKLKENMINLNATWSFSVFCVLLTFNLMSCMERPNIVIMVADDMGFDDVSFRGSNEFLTPNIDALAYSGVILKNFYTPAMCTPSRAALLTGKYPIHTGMQHYVIPNYQPWGLPTNETTMANIFKDNGYYTSIIGKWHLGMSRKNYTPTFRGFDHHYGYLGAYIDYYNHSLSMSDKTYSPGHDFRRNLDVTREPVGNYATELFTKSAVELIENHDFVKKPLFMFLSHLAPHSGNDNEPLQAPKAEIEKFHYIRNSNRRIYAAMVSLLDDGIGKVIDSLARRSVLNNTILLFFSDNGGPSVGLHANTASNYPLKGKDSPWEGGLRSSCAVWTPELKNPGTVWSQHVSIVDLLPTLANAANIHLDRNKLDGLDMWSALLAADNEANVEREIVHNIDDIFNYVSYTDGVYKFVNGTTSNGQYDDWFGVRPPGNSQEEDPRAQKYEEVIKTTTVWQQLQTINKFDSNAKPNITNIRAATAVECKFKTGNVRRQPCMPLEAPCLFNINDDPCEQENLFTEPAYTNISKVLIERIAWFRQSAVQPNNRPADPCSNPRFFDYEWTWWEDLQCKNLAVMHLKPLNVFFTLFLVFSITTM